MMFLFIGANILSIFGKKCRIFWEGECPSSSQSASASQSLPRLNLFDAPNQSRYKVWGIPASEREDNISRERSNYRNICEKISTAEEYHLRQYPQRLQRSTSRATTIPIPSDAMRDTGKNTSTHIQCVPFDHLHGNSTPHKCTRQHSSKTKSYLLTSIQQHRFVRETIGYFNLTKMWKWELLLLILNNLTAGDW